MTQEIRWHYRFRNFSRACKLLSEAFEEGIWALKRLEQEGAIRRFGHTFELGWKTLKDRLEYDGVVVDSVTPRDVIRTAADAGLISDRQVWVDMLDDRRSTSHQYDESILQAVLESIQERYLPALDALYQRLLAEVPDEPTIAPENS